MNTVKTFVLMLVMSGLLLLAGLLTYGITGVVVAAAVAMGLNFFAYWNSDKIGSENGSCQVGFLRGRPGVASDR